MLKCFICTLYVQLFMLIKMIVIIIIVDYGCELTLHSSMVVIIHPIVLYCLHPRGKTVVFFFK